MTPNNGAEKPSYPEAPSQAELENFYDNLVSLVILSEHSEVDLLNVSRQKPPVEGEASKSSAHTFDWIIHDPVLANNFLKAAESITLSVAEEYVLEGEPVCAKVTVSIDYLNGITEEMTINDELSVDPATVRRFSGNYLQDRDTPRDIYEHAEDDPLWKIDPELKKHQLERFDNLVAKISSHF